MKNLLNSISLIELKDEIADSLNSFNCAGLCDYCDCDRYDGCDDGNYDDCDCDNCDRD